MTESLANFGGAAAASAGTNLIGSVLGKGGNQPSVGPNGGAVLKVNNGQLGIQNVGVDNGGNASLISGLGTQVVQNVNSSIQKLKAAGINVDLTNQNNFGTSAQIGYNKANGGYFTTDSAGNMQSFGTNSNDAVLNTTKQILTQSGVNVNDPKIASILGLGNGVNSAPGVGSTITTPFGNITIDPQGNVTVNDTANLTGQETSAATNFGAELKNLQDQVIPGQGLISTAIQKQYDVAKQQLDEANRKAGADLEGNLSARNIAGSSFANNAQTQRQATYENQLNQLNANKADADAKSYLQELDLTNTLIGERAKLTLGAVQDAIKTSQFDTVTARSLSTIASNILSENARLQQQLSNQIQIANISGQNALNLQQSKQQFESGAATAQLLTQPLTSLFNDAFSGLGGFLGIGGSSTGGVDTSYLSNPVSSSDFLNGGTDIVNGLF